MKSPKSPTSLSSVRACKECPGLGCDQVPSVGPHNANLMIVGQNPGATEVKAGIPFVGASGELLNFMLDTAGIDRAGVYIANAVKCGTPDNRQAHPEEIATCYQHWLHQEISMVDPKFILLLGKQAYTSVVQNREPFAHLRTIKSKRRTYMMSYHPSYMLRRGTIEEFVVGVGEALRREIDALEV